MFLLYMYKIINVNNTHLCSVTAHSEFNSIDKEI